MRRLDWRPILGTVALAAATAVILVAAGWAAVSALVTIATAR